MNQKKNTEVIKLPGGRYVCKIDVEGHGKCVFKANNSTDKKKDGAAQAPFPEFGPLAPNYVTAARCERNSDCTPQKTCVVPVQVGDDFVYYGSMDIRCKDTYGCTEMGVCTMDKGILESKYALGDMEDTARCNPNAPYNECANTKWHDCWSSRHGMVSCDGGGRCDQTGRCLLDISH